MNFFVIFLITICVSFAVGKNKFYNYVETTTMIFSIQSTILFINKWKKDKFTGK